jgi:hypothetical protein
VIAAPSNATTPEKSWKPSTGHRQMFSLSPMGKKLTFHAGKISDGVDAVAKTGLNL